MQPSHLSESIRDADFVGLLQVRHNVAVELLQHNSLRRRQSLNPRPYTILAMLEKPVTPVPRSLEEAMNKIAELRSIRQC